MTDQRITRSDAGGVVSLTFSRPGSANAIDQQFAEEFSAASADVAGRDDVRVVVLRAEGSVFCAGGDVAAITSAPDPSTYIAQLTATLHAAVLTLRESEAVVVAVVEGAAVGAGFGLVLNADLAVGTPRASFASAFAAVGLTPDTGTSYWLPRVVGERRAADLVLRNRTLDAPTAREWGILADVWEQDDLDAEVAGLVQGLGRGPGRAFARTLRLLDAAGGRGLAEHLADEARTITELIDGADARQRIQSFLARRRA